MIRILALRLVEVAAVVVVAQPVRQEARAAVRDTRFEDAGNALAAARALGLSDTSEIDAVMEELANARSEQRVDETIALASARLEEGDLLSPANDNARYYYELVLSSDPSNTEARQGLNVIASKLVLQARSEIDAGNFDSAARTLANARAIDASNAELTSTESALSFSPSLHGHQSLAP